MPKTHKRPKKQRGGSSTPPPRTIEQQSVQPVRRPVRRPEPPFQGVWMSGFVALGCWGLAIAFIFLISNPNHILFGGMAAIMGLMWSSIFWVRVRQFVQKK